jgi:ankyrin repeat protein
LVRGLEQLKVTNGNGETPLFSAARSGNLEIVKYFVVNGADRRIKNNKN